MYNEWYWIEGFSPACCAARHAEKEVPCVSMATRGDSLPIKKCMGRNVVVMLLPRRQPNPGQLLYIPPVS